MSPAIMPNAFPAARKALRGRSVRDFVSFDQVDSQYPVFTKYASNPVFSEGDATAGTAASSILWPWVVRVDDILDSPLARYYMWYSTDHEGTDGHVRLAIADSLTGPWTDQGEVYRDAAGGNETETPAVIWNEAESLFFMYYQQVNPLGASSGVGQASCLATSPDGVTWTRVGIVLNLNAEAVWPRPSHTGYMRPFRVGPRWYAYHLLRGGDRGQCAISYSDDGRTWQTDPRPLPYHTDLVGGRRFDWLAASVVQWNGTLLIIAQVSDFISGYSDRYNRFVVAPLAPDLRSILAEPVELFDGNEAWETDNYNSGSILVENDRLWLFYRSGQPTLYAGAGAHFGAAYAEVSR